MDFESLIKSVPIKPYYKDESTAIYCSDNRQVLPLFPDKSFDLVLTDPPYNIGFDKYDVYTDDLEDIDYINMLAQFKGWNSIIMQYPEEMMRFVVPALGIPDEVMAWFYATDMPNRNFRLVNFYGILPDYSKVRQPYRWANDKRTRQLIVNGSAGAKHYDWIGDIPIVRNISPEKTEHPCPIPQLLVSRLIQLATEADTLILDPFLGSGTTAVAANALVSQ